jgi:hypothetical protein
MQVPTDIMHSMSTESGSRWQGGTGVSSSDIERAEELIGYRLPEEYRAWVLAFGAAYYGNYELNGVAPFSVRESGLPLVGDVAAKHKINLNQRDWNPEWLELLSLEGDEIYFIDNGQPGAPVMLLEAGQERPNLFASGFFDFLRRMP